MTKDTKLFDLIEQEKQRQMQGIELIASENFVSDQVMQAMGSVLTNKYAEGYPGARYYGGCQVVDQVEQLAIDRLCKLFGAEYANVQPHSGAQANMAVFRTVRPSTPQAFSTKPSVTNSPKRPGRSTTMPWNGSLWSTNPK